MSKLTQAERLARIEAILEESVVKELEEFKSEVRKEFTSINQRLDENEREFATYKNRGAGILIGVAIAAAVFGSKIQDLLKWAAGLGS